MAKKTKKEGETEHGTIIVKPTGDQTGFTHDGDEWELDKDGTMEIPVEYESIAKSHGFERVKDSKAKAAPAAPAGKSGK